MALCKKSCFGVMAPVKIVIGRFAESEKSIHWKTTIQTPVRKRCKMTMVTMAMQL